MMRTIVAAVVILGRRVQPAALATTIAMLAVGATWLDADLIFGPWETVASIAALALAAALTAGWLLNSPKIMRVGFLGATVVWVYTAWVAFTGAATLTSALVAVALAVLAGGSYWLEQVEAERVKKAAA